MSTLAYRGPVVGLSFYDYGQYIDRIKVGTRLIIRPESSPTDPRALGVFFSPGPGYVRDQIGWIPKSRNLELFGLINQWGLKYLPAVVTNHDRDKSFDSRLFIQAYESNEMIPQSRSASPSTPKEKTMLIKSAFERNKRAVASAGFLEAGRIANKKVTEVLAKKAPLAVRGYIDTPVGRLVLANMTMIAMEQFRPNDRAAMRLAESMTVTAYMECIQHFDIEGVIDGLMNSTQVKRAMSLLDKEIPAAE